VLKGGEEPKPGVLACRLALESREVKALRTRLPLLLRQSDERVLEALAPGAVRV
jgi:hypothetical protein